MATPSSVLYARRKPSCYWQHPSEVPLDSEVDLVHRAKCPSPLCDGDGEEILDSYGFPTLSHIRCCMLVDIVGKKADATHPKGTLVHHSNEAVELLKSWHRHVIHTNCYSLHKEHWFPPGKRVWLQVHPRGPLVRLQQEVADAAEAARAAAAEAAVAAAAEAETEAEISEPEPETEVITVDEGPSASTWKYAAPATAGKKRANSEVPMPAKKMIMTQSPVTPPKDTASKPSSSEQFMDGACAMPSQAGVATVKETLHGALTQLQQLQQATQVVAKQRGGTLGRRLCSATQAPLPENMQTCIPDSPASISISPDELVRQGWVDTMASAFSADKEGYERYKRVIEAEKRIAQLKTRLEEETDEEVYDLIQAQVEEKEIRVHNLLDDFEGYPAAEIHNIWNEVYFRLSGRDLHLRDIPDIDDL